MNAAAAPDQPQATRNYPKARPKVPPFARYVGTSAWRKYKRRVREYALYRAALKLAESTARPAA